MNFLLWSALVTGFALIGKICIKKWKNILCAAGVLLALFVPVMYAGALPKGSTPWKKLMSVRGELSILGGIFVLGHNASTILQYIVESWQGGLDLPLSHRLAGACSLVMLAVLLPLWVTSFPAVRRRMSSRSWKRLQRWAYLFYALTYVHVFLLFFPRARAGNTGAALNVLVFSAVYLLYAGLRLKKAAHSGLPLAAAALVCGALGLLLFTGAPDEPAPEQHQLGSGQGEKWKNGVFKGKGRGYGGPVRVEVTVEDDRILSVVVTDHQEDAPYWRSSHQVTVDRILEAQDWKVDTVTGATKSCKGIQKAVRAALKAAEID